MNALDDLYSAGDTVCSECGLVLESHSIDETSEWRTFANESNDNDPVRVACSCRRSNESIARRRSLSTVISKPNGTIGDFLSSSLGRWQNRGSNPDRSLLLALKTIATMADRESFEAGLAGRVVDCILALKSYHEWKQTNAGNGFYKNVKSPLVLHSANKNLSRPLNALSTDACRHLDMSAEDGDKGSLEDSIVKAITDYMVETKENISNNLLASFHTGKLDPVKTLSKILASGLEGQLLCSSAEIQDILREWTSSAIQSAILEMIRASNFLSQYLKIYCKIISLNCLVWISIGLGSVAELA